MSEKDRRLINLRIGLERESAKARILSLAEKRAQWMSEDQDHLVSVIKDTIRKVEQEEMD